MNSDAKLLKECIKEYANLASDKTKRLKEKVFRKGALSDFSNEITNDWYIADFFDVTHLITCGVAKRPEYVDEGIPFLSAQNARPFKANLNKIRYIDNETFEKITVGGKPEKDDILYTRVGNCGEAAKIPYDFNFGIYVSLTLIKPVRELLDTDYLVAFLNSKYGLIQAGQGAIGIGLKNLNVDNVRRYIIPLPPLAEQKQIATKLNELLAQVDSIKARLDAIAIIVKRFRQSVLAAAVSGKLSEEWRKENNASEWLGTTFDEIAITSGNGLSKRSGNLGRDVTVLRLADFKKGKRISGKERKITLTETECDKYTLSNGDLLTIRVNGSVDLAGLFILYSEKNNEEAFCDHFIRFTINKLIAIPEYIIFITNEGEGRRFLRDSLSTSAGQNTINQKSIKSLPISLPSLSEQTEIVRRVQQLFTYSDQIKKRVKDAQTRVNNLTQSILAKAFRGELTAEWRKQNPGLISGENSAEALLEKIMIAREAIKPTKKIKRKKIA